MRPRRRRLAATLLEVTQLGHSGWFCGNLYEAIVQVPELQARQRDDHDDQKVLSPLGSGSPVRYYAVAAPAVLPALFAAVGVGWPQRSSRPWLVAAAGCSSLNVALTAHLVRTVNLKLFFNAEPGTVPPAERERMLRTWHRLNTVRLVLTAGAWLAARGASRALSQ